ncbi:hypothetical protein IAT38_006633 [Cryptococcus sp. DSM 104549]
MPVDYRLAQSTDDHAFDPIPQTPINHGRAQPSKSDPVIQLRGQVLDKTRAQAADTNGTNRLKGRVGIITGVGSDASIGTAAAKLFAREGAAHLYLLDYDDRNAPALLAFLKETYPQTKVTFQKGDAADPKAISSLVNQALEDEGYLDFFFANAGVSQVKGQTAGKPGSLMSFVRPVGDVPEDEFNEVMRINALGVFIAIKYASSAMAKLCPEKGKTIAGGSIILTASVAGKVANAGPIPYSASKAAVISMAQTSAYDLTGKNVRVNAICPGLIETEMTRPMFDKAKDYGTTDKIGNLNPTLRQGIGYEVAQTALFLASDDSSYINGQAIPVDGGLTAGAPYVRTKM